MKRASTAAEKSKATELLKLDLEEVSLVDRGAVGRRFAVIKRQQEGQMRNKRQKPGTSSAVNGQPAQVPAQKADEEGNVEGGETESTVDVDTQKAATPILRALTTERLTSAKDKLDQIIAGMGTLTKNELYTLMWDVHDILYAASSDVVTVAKSLGIDDMTATVPAEKGYPKKMTSRRLKALEEAATKLVDLLKEFDPDDDDSTTQEGSVTKAAGQNTEGGAGASGAETNLVDQIVSKMSGVIDGKLAPLEARLQTVEKSLKEQPAQAPAQAPAATTTQTEQKAAPTPAAPAEPPEPSWVKEIRETVKGFNSRLNTIEGGAGASPPVNATEETKAKKSEAKPGSSEWWGGGFSVGD